MNYRNPSTNYQRSYKHNLTDGGLLLGGLGLLTVGYLIGKSASHSTHMSDLESRAR